MQNTKIPCDLCFTPQPTLGLFLLMIVANHRKSTVCANVHRCISDTNEAGQGLRKLDGK